jgi:hypothetical protein
MASCRRPLLFARFVRDIDDAGPPSIETPAMTSPEGRSLPAFRVENVEQSKKCRRFVHEPVTVGPFDVSRNHYGQGDMAVSEIFGGIALLVSGYSLWQSTLKRSNLTVFVAPVIRYASPYSNSNFEAFAIPVTIANEGARTGVVLGLQLVVRDPANNISKRFFSADFGEWSIEKAQKGGFRPFAPIVLAGRSSHTETIVFHSRNDETVMQIVRDTGRFEFTLTLDAALSEQFGFLDRLWRKPPQPLKFEMTLPVLDHRAFSSGSGTLPLHHANWQSTVS